MGEFSSYLSTVGNIGGCAFGKAAGWAKYVFKLNGSVQVVTTLMT